jgi:predicted ATPase
MKLASFCVEGFKSVLSAEILNCGSINIFIGKNNSGKSTLFNAIQKTPRFPNINTGGIGDRNRNIADPTRLFKLNMLFKLVSEERTKIPRVSGANPEADYIKFEYGERTSPDNIWFNNLTVYRGDACEIATNLASSRDDKLIAKQIAFGDNAVDSISPDLTVENKNISGMMQTPYFWPFRLLGKYLSGIYRFSNRRRSARSGIYESSPRLKPDGSNLVPVLMYLSHNEEDIFRNINAFANAVVPEIGELSLRDSGDNKLEVFFRDGTGHYIPLHEMGDGIEQLLLIGTVLHSSDYASSIYIEEPENYIHPGAQKRMLREMLKVIGNRQIFMTTHSPSWFEYAKEITTYSITNEQGQGTKCCRLEGIRIREAIDDVGISPSMLVQSDVVIFVEGPRDVAVWRHWLQRIEDIRDIDIAIVSLGGDDASSDDFSIEDLIKICSKPICVFDSERTKKDGPEKESRTKLKRKCKELNIPCYLTKRKSIENYFTVKALRETYGNEEIPSEFELDYYLNLNCQIRSHKKKKCKEIAEKMRKSDLLETDLIRVIEKIRQYAIKIRNQD